MLNLSHWQQTLIKLLQTFWKNWNISSHFFILILKIHLSINRCYLPHTNQEGFLPQEKHKFHNLSDINVTNLKLQPIVDRTGICNQKTGKLTSKDLKPLTKNEFVTNNMQDFPALLNNVPILQMKMLVMKLSRCLQISLSKTQQILFVRKYMCTRN